MKKESVGQRGKLAEKAVEKVLKLWNNKAHFAYWRLPDARSAMGRVAAQPGDFCYFSHPNAGIIEVKTTEHSFRVAKDKISQLPVLHKLDLAGAGSIILILHSTENVWRAVRPSQLESGAPSWDLRGVPVHPSAESALLSTGFFYV